MQARKKSPQQSRSPNRLIGAEWNPTTCQSIEASNSPLHARLGLSSQPEVVSKPSVPKRREGEAKEQEKQEQETEKEKVKEEEGRKGEEEEVETEAGYEKQSSGSEKEPEGPGDAENWKTLVPTTGHRTDIPVPPIGHLPTYRPSQIGSPGHAGLDIKATSSKGSRSAKLSDARLPTSDSSPFLATLGSRKPTRLPGEPIGPVGYLAETCTQSLVFEAPPGRVIGSVRQE
ncbi:unnamed protein product [Protopolystoma xenopodis]|uniref:Uncharacterized protein n=1 Tax=Protopolystoma xenopodis TaxID=117903 RepID=A0A3S5A2S6_9PLAT|nr:unnamed protein product [Protopolystoma xenopodis]